jgi:hypothetical protein
LPQTPINPATISGALSQADTLRASAPPKRASQVEAAIAGAAKKTQVDFDYLLAQARVESGLDPSAQARTSSALGLFQFIESTWLSTMQRHGGRFGLDHVARQIGPGANGRPAIANATTRAAILDLRRDPAIASQMAAALAQDNRAALKPVLGREPGHGELYLAHFLGAGDAARFLNEHQDDPSQKAAALFPRPAAANRGIFYDGAQARSLAGVLDHLTAKLERAGAAGLPTAEPITGPIFSPGAPALIAAHNQPPNAVSTSGPRSVGASAFLFAPARFGSRSALVAAPLFAAPQRPMSESLATSFAADSQPPASHIRRAYQQMKALGL